MKHILFILSILVLGQSLNANEPYRQILITKTSHKQNLKRIKKQLDAIHIKMFVQRKNTNFFIYSKKIFNGQEATHILKKIKHSFKYAKLLYRGDKPQEKSQTKKEKINKYFVNFALGMQNISGDAPESALSYSLEAGYNYSKDTFLTLSYQNTSFSTLSINNIFISANKIYEFNSYSDIYVGALLGYGRLKKSGFSQSASILFGAQAGYRYKIYNYLEAFTQYQGIYMDQIVQLSAGTALQFNFTHTLQLGLTYKF